VFNCHLRLKVESGDDAELFDRTTAGGRSSFVDPRSNPGTKGKRVRERESKKRKRRNFLPLLLLDVGGVSRAWRTTAPLPLWYFFCRLTAPLSLPLSSLVLRWQRSRARAKWCPSCALTRTHTECVCAREWPQIVFFVLFDLSLNHLGCYIYKDIFIDLIIKECGEWVERKSEDVFFSFFRQNQERISLARAPEKRGGKSLEDRDGKNSSSTGVKSLLTCNEVLARIVKSRWLVSGACGRFP